MNISEKINKLVSQKEAQMSLGKFAFISLGKSNMKATVKLLKNSRYLERDILKQCEKFRKKAGVYPIWIKLDIVTDTENVCFDDLVKELVDTRRNYIDFGIALDKFWNTVFLAEEINANAFVRPDKKDKSTFILSEENINNYLRKYTAHNKRYSHKFYQGKQVIKFYTKSFICDENHIYSLGERGLTKNLRTVEDLDKEFYRLIEKGTEYLKNMLHPSGKYDYGYFPHFDKKINFYNILRHASSTYALIEGLNYLEKDLTPVEKALEYLINNYIYERQNIGYVFDDTNNINEIKLGQNAAFVFAICEYLKHNPGNKQYLKKAQDVASGILKMINLNTGETIHVLNYPDLTVKDKQRIVYYDGEAALALLRLYQIDHNETWLEAVKTMFEHFITHNYWQYHDHWLGYCTNELVQIDPQEKYYRFGIQNVSNYLDYIKYRDTTYPTFLEMLMATHKTIENAKANGHEKLVKELIDEEKFLNIIDIRANYERTGFFYPEIAMYFKNPERILGSFFIKHHGYRVRIDDIEHYLSGYVQYQKVFNS